MLLHIKVKTGWKKDAVTKKNDTSYIVSVKEEAKENRANKKMLELMAETLGGPVAAIRLITGHHMPSKIIEVLGR
jgi:uncharacterized protein YggU (UPF0235/DUF167 family)